MTVAFVLDSYCQFWIIIILEETEIEQKNIDKGHRCSHTKLKLYRTDAPLYTEKKIEDYKTSCGPDILVI